MLQRWFLALTAVLAVGGALALADEDIYLRGKEKPVRGKITKESIKGVVLGVKDEIAAEEILDIVYELTPVSANIAYRAAVKAEKDSLDPANSGKSKQLLNDALKRYEDVAKVATDKNAKRHVEYKIAQLNVRLVREEGAEPEKAVLKLRDFTKKYPASWQYARAMDTLGKLQLSAKDYEGAEETYKTLAANEELPAEERQDAQLSAIQVKIAAGQHGEAKGLLQQLQKSLPPGSRFATRARVAEAECLVADNKLDDAVKLVRGVLKDTNDGEVKAAGHNTLGYCFYKTGQLKDARWEFLWVDVVYNQDRQQHAKALYHLWRIFSELGEAERAQETRELLLSPQFAGLDYQRMAQKEAAKTP